MRHVSVTGHVLWEDFVIRNMQHQLEIKPTRTNPQQISFQQAQVIFQAVKARHDLHSDLLNSILQYCKHRYFRVYTFSRFCFKKIQFRVYLDSQILEYGSCMSILDRYSRCAYFRGFSFPRNLRKCVQRELKYVCSIFV